MSVVEKPTTAESGSAERLTQNTSGSRDTQNPTTNMINRNAPSVQSETFDQLPVARMLFADRSIDDSCAFIDA